MTEFNHPITSDDIDQMQADLEVQPKNEVISRAIMTNGIDKASEDPRTAVRLNRTFSVDLETGTVSNQKHSGRCWLFSLLNTLRHKFAVKYNKKDFELSQNYLFFWDKIERANMFYDRMITLADRPTSDRDVDFYLSMPGEDGGQWAMAAALVQKYGVIPKEAFPETAVTDDTTDYDEVMDRKLRHDGMVLRNLVNSDASDYDINQMKQKMMSEVYRMTAYSFGVPPKTFDLEYRDDDKKYHLDQGLTPKQFYDKYIGVDLNDYVVLTNSPDKKMDEMYSLPSQNNVEGGMPIEFLNAPMDELKEAAIKQLKDGETVWFGNDVLHQMNRQKGYLDSKLYRQAALFGVDMTMTKAERLEYHEAEVSHAMTLTGVDLINDVPTKWKVENSWGKKVGDDGYFAMTDEWIQDFVYEVVVKKSYLKHTQKEVLKKTPIKLDPWDSLQ
ncbi:C1 family peptidase [Fructilactobacillus fructivorans]|uniref:Aminopeptidase n=1 Tax=Fructilactobacillus fructivorans TaxID=1614 RepID=A0A0C1PP13_9LACO|nr:C1 family peptidase [Fructilactobacillus fructivorans]KID42507.1 Aminopeptidase C [Fructilactobacillus fructivorans]MCT0151578.1 aminopeptidase [Fructilactobacillus fructivorans]MCT2868112.1 aminopeptidase [Fructilactobacillus fructivorans]MCT2868609.1 aminopeptidase [Fructilactobacillus fructivorans]MCT2873765.1 aminopeptidase [Fructilactobacillus fructivorans]